MYSKQTVSSHYLSNSTPKINTQIDPYSYTLNGQFNRQYQISHIQNKLNINLSKYPEVVILFQAAQIERLNNAINSSRIQNKGMKKEYLDRHSYEIQIKQLTIVLDEAREQNKGLKKRIQQLNNVVSSAEISINNTHDIGSLSNKYERALLQIGKMYDDNTKLQQQVNQLHWKISEMQENNKKIGKNGNYVGLVLNEQQNNTMIEEATRHLRDKIAQLEERNSESVIQLRQSFNRQMEKYKKMMVDGQKMNKQQMEEQLVKANTTIKKLNSQLLANNDQKWKLECKLKQNELKIKEYESKIYHNELELSKYLSQVNALNDKVSQFQNSAYFSHSPQNTMSLSLSKSESKANQQSSSFSDKLKKQSLSIQSSYTSPNVQKNNIRDVQQLQNNIVLLSQEIERLNEVIKIKNGQFGEMEEKYRGERAIIEKQLISIRMKYEGDLRKEQQRRDDEEQRLKREIEKCRRKVQDWEMSNAENANRYKQQIMGVKQEERRTCEAVFEKKLKVLEQQYGRDRSQLIRLRKQLQSSYEQIDGFHQNQVQIQSEKRLKELKYLQKIQQQQKKYEYKVRDLQQQLHQREQRKYGQVKQKNREQILKLQKKLQQQSELLRSKQLQYREELAKIVNRYEQSIKEHNNYKNNIEEEYQRVLKQKQRQLSQIAQSRQKKNQQGEQFVRKQGELLMKRIDFINEQFGSAKNMMMETISRSKSNQIGQSELSRIRLTMEQISTQIVTLSKQVMQALLDQNPKIPLVSPQSQNCYYSQQYVKQLQAECDNYLKLINGKIVNNDEEIQKNNRYNRAEQEKWQSAFTKQEHILGEYQEEKFKWEQIQIQNQRMKYELQREKQRMGEEVLRVKAQYQQQLVNITNGYQRQIENQKIKTTELLTEISTKQVIIIQYKKKLISLTVDQNEQLAKLTKILESRNKQLQNLTSTVEQYKNKYIVTKDKLRIIEGIIQKLLKDSYNDLQNVGKLEQQNIQLRKDIQKIGRQLVMEKEQKQKIVEKSRQQVLKITHQLTQQNLLQQQLTNQEYDQQNNKIRHLQRQFDRLSEIITTLKKDNYHLTKQNYDEETQEHVNREFAVSKICDLNKQIERLITENIDLKDDIWRCRLEMSEKWDQRKRNQENMGLMVLLFVEIQALRKRFIVEERL